MNLSNSWEGILKEAATQNVTRFKDKWEVVASSKSSGAVLRFDKGN
jgi:hypothetical protein